MRLPFGLEITRRKAAPQTLAGVDGSRGWMRVFDWKPGAWQQDAAAEVTDLFAQSTVYACHTLIAGDIGKLRLRLVERRGRIWTETTSRFVVNEQSGRLEAYAISRDLTERRQAREELKRSETRFRSAFDSMLEGCQIIGFDWRYL